MDSNMLRFENKVVVVTGASSGIGAAIATAFGSLGARVGVGYNQSETGAQAVIKEIEAAGGTAIGLRADVADPQQMAGLVSTATEQLGVVDVLINNAGTQIRRASIEETTDEFYDQMMNINLRSVFTACRAVIPSMSKRGSGAIVNLSSISARHGGGGRSVLYAAAKAGVATFTRGLAAELATSGVRVNAVSPGLISTPFHDQTPPEQFEAITTTIPMGRPGTAQDCVGPTLFLASDDLAGYVTGQVLEVNGGQYRP